MHIGVPPERCHQPWTAREGAHYYSLETLCSGSALLVLVPLPWEQPFTFTFYVTHLEPTVRKMTSLIGGQFERRCVFCREQVLWSLGKVLCPAEIPSKWSKVKFQTFNETQPLDGPDIEAHTNVLCLTVDWHLFYEVVVYCISEGWWMLKELVLNILNSSIADLHPRFNVLLVIQNWVTKSHICIFAVCVSRCVLCPWTKSKFCWNI